jgi:hypothetical protein
VIVLAIALPPAAAMRWTAAGALALSGEVRWAIGFLVLTAAVTIAGELRVARGDSPNRQSDPH